MNTSSQPSGDGQPGKPATQSGARSAPSAPSLPDAPARPRTPAEELAAVEALLSGRQPPLASDPEDDNDDPDEDAGATGEGAGAGSAPEDEIDPEGGEARPAPAEEPPERIRVKDVAKRLGVTPDQLYDALEISTGDGGWTATLGELKAAYSERDSADREVVERAVGLDRREAELASDIQVMGILAARNALPQAVLRQAQAGLAEMAERETRNFFALAPEFRDDEVRASFNARAEAMLKPYGISAGALGVVPAGLRLFMRDMIRMQDRLAKLTKKQPQPLPKSQKSSGRFEGSRVKPPGPQASEADRVAYVSRLIGE